MCGRSLRRQTHVATPFGYHPPLMSRNLDEPHLSPQLSGLRPSATLAISEHCNALTAEGRKIYRLGLGQSPFPVPGHVVQALRDAAQEKDYLPAAGLYDLRRAVAHYTERRVGIDRTAADVLIGPGSKSLLYLLQVVFDGDLIVPTPSWTPYAAQARAVGGSIRWIETRADESFLLDPERLAEALSEDPERPKLVLLTHPNNPTGATARADRLRALAAAAREHSALLLSDEIYAELHHKGKHLSIARYYPEGTIISTGLSKWCGGEGWRLGAYVFPERLRWLLDAMAALASEIFTSTCTPVQYAAIVAFDGGEAVDHYLRHARRVLSALGRWCARKLRAAGVACPQPLGGVYLFVDFSTLRERLAARGIRTSRELCARLLQRTGVATLPAADFGRADHELMLRLAYVDFDGEKALEAVAVIPIEQPLDQTFLKRHCRPVVTAVTLIAAWLEEPSP